MLFSYKGWDQITPGFSAPTNPFPGSSAFPGGWELPVEIGSTFLFNWDIPLGWPSAELPPRVRLWNGPGLPVSLRKLPLCPCGSVSRWRPGKLQVLPLHLLEPQCEKRGRGNGVVWLLPV